MYVYVFKINEPKISLVYTLKNKVGYTALLCIIRVKNCINNEDETKGCIRILRSFLYTTHGELFNKSLIIVLGNPLPFFFFFTIFIILHYTPNFYTANYLT